MLMRRVIFYLANFHLRFKKIVFRFGSYAQNSSFAEYVHLDPFVSLYNCNLGGYTYVSRSTTIVNGRVGRYTSIGPECKIGLGRHPLQLLGTSPLFYNRKNKFNFSLRNVDFDELPLIDIGNDVWVGARVLVMSGCKIGDGAVIAAGSVVTKDVEPYSIVGGVPAKFIKKRFSDEEIDKLINLGWWTMNHLNLNDVLENVVDNVFDSKST